MHGIFRGKYRGQGKRDNQPFSVDGLPPLKKNVHLHSYTYEKLHLKRLPQMQTKGWSDRTNVCGSR